jgi:hypothetical protein
VALRVQRDRLAVVGQVNGQLRHPQDRSVDTNQPVGDRGAVAHRQPAAHAEIAIQPGVQPGTPVGLQRHHLPSRDLAVGMLLDPQIGAIGMSADDPERPSRIAGIIASAVPRHQRARAHGEESAGVGPRVCLGQLGVAGGP